NFRQTGLLAQEANRVEGTDIVLKYAEPPDARQPPASQDWRLYVFKGAETLDTVPLWTRSCWLMGREGRVVDMRVEHPSASKQHAVIQFKYVTRTNEFGDKKSMVKPYLIDLDSANGTSLNGDRIPGSRYIEVKSGDVLRIGLSEREYVFMLPPKT
ncbi:SMAD/FHA domain-containing protein, partial [Microthyrium microscopicum]